MYNTPQSYDDGIETASLNSVGMDSLPVIEMMNYLNSKDGHKIHNILIIKDNKLVFEEYFEGYALDMNAPGRNGAVMEYNKDTDHFMASVSKSVTSVIFGIAVKEGYIDDLNKKVIDYFPEYTAILTGGKADITIAHLLTMTCGLTFDENSYPYGDSRNDVTRLFSEDDPIKFILSKELTSTPGTQFFYNSGAVNVLAAIVEKATGMKFLDYANAKLFDPLRSVGGVWSALNSGLVFASGGLSFKARELSKIGLLFLNEGMWEGNQIITPEWIAASQEEYIVTHAIFPDTSYGYYWWIMNYIVNGVSYKCFFAAGWGDQYMFIIPGLEMIVVINSGNYDGSGSVSAYNLMKDHILKAL
ncbi:MAG TPA: serine hydrolase [Bacteroidales bacterium]|nr:serine hydrolase [Bacteroidales bacterium]